MGVRHQKVREAKEVGEEGEGGGRGARVEFAGESDAFFGEGVV